VLKYFGQLSLVLVILTLAPLGVSLIWGDFPGAIRYAFIVIGIGCLESVLARLPKPAHAQLNEAMVLVSLIFLFSSYR
jgi:trk system potassium uptake protein TrkH